MDQKQIKARNRRNAENSRRRRERDERRELNSLGILYVLFTFQVINGIACSIFPLMLFFSLFSSPNSPIGLIITCLILGVIGILLLMGPFWFAKRKPIGYNISLVFSYFLLLSIPIGTIIGILSLGKLKSMRRAYFNAGAERPHDSNPRSFGIDDDDYERDEENPYSAPR